MRKETIGFSIQKQLINFLSKQRLSKSFVIFEWKKKQLSLKDFPFKSFVIKIEFAYKSVSKYIYTKIQNPISLKFINPDYGTSLILDIVSIDLIELNRKKLLGDMIPIYFHD